MKGPLPKTGLGSYVDRSSTRIFVGGIQVILIILHFARAYLFLMTLMSMS